MNTFASKGYPGASGANGFYCGAQNGTTLYINDIALPTDGYGKYRFTAGFNVYVDNQNYSPEGYVTLSLSYGTTTKPLTYTVEQYERWYFVTSEFEFAAGAVPSKVSLLITFTTSNIRVDDPKLVWFGQDSGSGTAPGPGSGTDESVALKTPYYEYPETLTSSSDYVYGTLRGTTYSSKQNVRNYSYCYDVRRHNPMWVAYPCHDIWWEGGYTRPNPDPWRPNPDLKESQQSVIYAADWNSWPWSDNNKKPSDTYNYWSMTTDGGVMMSKGHMMRSAERGAGRSNVLFGMNDSRSIRQISILSVMLMLRCRMAQVLSIFRIGLLLNICCLIGGDAATLCMLLWDAGMIRISTRRLMLQIGASVRRVRKSVSYLQDATRLFCAQRAVELARKYRIVQLMN
jgi:endonuclease G